MLTASTHGKNATLPAHINAEECTSFGYFFPDAPIPDFNEKTEDHLGELFANMVGRATDPTDGALPPIFTYLGQFIDHDITNQMDIDPAVTDNIGPIDPQDRDVVLAAIKNQRTGQLDLDSLYGPQNPSSNPTLNKLMAAMRFPADPAKMRLAFPDPNTKFVAEFPTDRAADLLRLERVFGQEVTQADLDALPDDHKGLFLDSDGNPNLSRALIGDNRNDENLFISQVHMAFLRLHNTMVDAIRADNPGLSTTAVFENARRAMQWTYQWMIMNIYLPGLCDPVALRDVVQSDAVLYGDFLGQCDLDHGMPMPLEFSVAAFRFGHSMVRPGYDWNDRFGRDKDGNGDLAPFELFFAFTANGNPPMFGESTKLPANWVGDFTRLVTANATRPDRVARLIDTKVALPLTNMQNEDKEGDTDEEKQLRRNLIARNLRRGFRMNVPSAQACADKLRKTYGFDLPMLTKAQLKSGSTGSIVDEANFDDETPLWFYVLKEAEVMHRGQRLGPLGTHLIAGTLCGLVIHDPDSYWHKTGSIEGRWHPVDGPRPNGQIVDSLPAFFRAAGLMKT